MTAYRLFPSTNGPSAATTYTGSFISAVAFCVTGEAWFTGYWWWVCNSGQSTSAVKCALWQGAPYPSNGSSATWGLVPGSVVTSGTLTAGQWNYVPLPVPIPLSLGGSPGMSTPISASGTAIYCAAVGVNGPFPDTNNSFGAGHPHAVGITNGILTAYSANSGTMGFPPGTTGLGQGNGLFSVDGSDPSTTPPTTNDSTNDNFWVDVQVSDYSGAPAGTSLRLWPSLPHANYAPNGDNTVAVSATAFTLSKACKLDRIWMYSSPGSTGLPTRIGIWNTTTQTEVSGTDDSSPSWTIPGGGSASGGAGWIYVDYTSAGVTLPAGDYAVAYYNGSGLLIYNDDHNYFFAGTNPRGGGTVGGAGWNGISWGGGILTAPNVANGPVVAYDDSSGNRPGQQIYLSALPTAAPWAYPGQFEATSDWGETRWADVEVTPVASGSGLVMASFP
jgi:hypothetical protein